MFNLYGSREPFDEIGTENTFQGTYIIENPYAATKSTYHQIVKFLVEFQVRYRYRRKSLRPLMPFGSAIETDPQPAVAAQKYQVFITRMRQYAMHIAHFLMNAFTFNISGICHILPRGSAVGGHKNIGIPVVLTVIVHHGPTFVPVGRYP